MNLKVKKLHPDAKLPSYAHSYDAGMDLFALEDTEISPGEVAKIKTGIAMEIPEGYVGLCWDKSSVSIGNKIKLLGGVIDSGYRGEILIGFVNLGESTYKFEKGHKVAQLLIEKVEHPEILEAEELSETARGEGGFGSTGK